MNNNRDLYSIIAGILPPLLGLGLVEVYIEREVSLVVIVAGLVALTVLVAMIPVFVDLAAHSRDSQRRRRRRTSRA